MTPSTNTSITVGVDGSDAALAAVRWAATEAQARETALRLCCAVHWPDGYHFADIPVAVEPEHDVLVRARRSLDEATAVSRAAAPSVPIATELVPANPVDMLVGASDSDRVVVLGSRGLGGFTGLLLGSTAIGVTARARGPVVVVRGKATAGGDSRVVVGLDGSTGDDTALAFAFDEAATRDVGLLALHTWHDELVPYAREPIMIDWAQVRRAERADIEQRLDALRTRYPQVTVELAVTKGQAARSLVELSDNASLLVVGSRGRGGIAGLLLGSTSQTLIRHAACPVAVVPRHGAAHNAAPPGQNAAASHSE